MAPKTLSQRDIEVMAFAFQSLKTPPEVSDTTCQPKKKVIRTDLTCADRLRQTC